MRVIGRVLFFSGLLGVLTGFLVLLWFHGWRTSRFQALADGSEVVETELGIIEVADRPGKGTPIVVLHGGGGGYDQGLVIANTLIQEGRRVLAVSRPGYLRTPLISGLLPEQQADLLEALLIKKDIEQAELLAFGEGAVIAVQAVLRHPQRYTRLALLSPIVLQSRAAPSGKFFLPAEAMLESVTGDMGAWWIDMSSGFFQEDTLFAFLETETTLIPYECQKLARSILLQPAQAKWFRDYLWCLTPISPRETGIRNDIVQLQGLPALDFSKIQQPVLILRGEVDRITPKEDAAKLLSTLRNVEEFVLPGAGYLLPGMGPATSLAEQKLVDFFTQK